MGVKIGRNDPCPCGSGAKYKFCCLNRAIDNEGAVVSPRFRFEPGSYGSPGTSFLPSIGCLEQWKLNAWRYHFVLVKLDVECSGEAEAVLIATEDLNSAFDGAGSPGERVAECLKSLGYLRVERFKIVDQVAGPVG
jgi:hypothetical protein